MVMNVDTMKREIRKSFEKETPMHKLAVTILYSSYAVICGLLSASHLSRWSNAKKIDDAFSDVNEKYYDTMWALDSVDPSLDRSSHFSNIFAFSSVLMAILVPINIGNAIGNYILPVRLCFACIDCCAGCAYFALLILVAVWRFNSVGNMAAESLTPIEFDDSFVAKIDPAGRTYSDDASLILTLYIV